MISALPIHSKLPWTILIFLLNVNFSIILVITQHNAQFLFYNKFIIFLYMFRALLRSSSGGQIVLYSIWYRHIL